MKAGIAGAIMILFGGAFVGFLVKTFNDNMIIGTSVEENMQVYLVPFTIFVALIIGAFFAVFRSNRKKNVP